MGRKPKEFFDMTKRQLSFLLKDEGVEKRVKVCETILESMLKSRGVRKSKYKDELKKVHQYLCVKATDHDNLKKKYKELEAKYEQSQMKNSILSDRNIRLQMQKK